MFKYSKECFKHFLPNVVRNLNFTTVILMKFDLITLHDIQFLS